MRYGVFKYFKIGKYQFRFQPKNPYFLICEWKLKNGTIQECKICLLTGFRSINLPF